MSDEAEMAWGRQQYDQQAGRGSLVVPDSVFADDAVGLMACERLDDAADKAKIEAAKQKKIDERERTRREIFEEVEESAKEAHDDLPDTPRRRHGTNGQE